MYDDRKVARYDALHSTLLAFVRDQGHSMEETIAGARLMPVQIRNRTRGATSSDEECPKELHNIRRP
jgi:hypothetical protein